MRREWWLRLTTLSMTVEGRRRECRSNSISEVTFDRLAPVLENAIYRIVQEGLTNALRHSQSKKVRIELIQVDKELQVVIQDWGIGFGPEKEGDEEFRIEGIRERARLLGGRLPSRLLPAAAHGSL